MDEGRQVKATWWFVDARGASAEVLRSLPKMFARQRRELRRSMELVGLETSEEHLLASQWAPVAEAREFHERRGNVPRGGADLAAEFDRLRQPVPSWLMWLAVWIVAIGSGLAMFWISSGVGP